MRVSESSLALLEDAPVMTTLDGSPIMINTCTIEIAHKK
jgi:hypothetical protein